MSGRATRMVARATRATVRILLLVHPRKFREAFAAEILADLDAEFRDADKTGMRAVLRVARRAIADTIAALSGPRPHIQEPQAMGTWLHGTIHDLRIGVRGFLRDRTFTTSVVLTLALGIGLNAAMFGVVDRLLLSGPAHVREPERVRRIQITSQQEGRPIQRDGWFGYAAYDVLRRQNRTCESIAAYSIVEESTVLGRGAGARRINRGEATSSLFSLLGVTPALGRFFTETEDDTSNPANVVVLGYSLWQREFGGRGDVLGKPIVLNETTYTIVGVAPKAFTGPDLTRVDVWFPESLFGRSVVSPNWTTSWNGWWLSIVVRLKPGVTAEQADAEATRIFRSAYGGPSQALRKATLSMKPLVFNRSGIESMESRISFWLLAVAGIVLLVSCANVTNLVLAQGIRRRREMAVRSALGAGRARLIRIAAVEALALAIAGGAAGLVVAYVVGTIVRAWLIPGVEWPGGPVDGRILVVSLTIAVAAGIAVGLLPAVRGSAPDVSTSLKSGSREGGGQRSRLRATLTIVQAALSALLLVGAGLFEISLDHINNMDLGLEPDRVLMFGVQRASMAGITDQAERQRERDRRTAFYPIALERVRQRPDVEAASLTIGLSFYSGFGDEIRVPGRDKIPQLKGGGPFLSAVTSDYFRTVGTRIVRGRPFTADDRAGTAPVAIVNETMARTLWPSEDAIGKCFYVGQSTSCAEIVGVAADTRQFKLQEDESMAFYLPFGQEQGIGGTQLLVRPRAGGDPRAAIRQELIALDPTIVFVRSDALQDRIDPLVRPWKLGAMMFSFMGLLALIVSALGLYSVMSYFVTNRSHEIGVRMALGAQPADVARLVVRSGLALVGAGLVLGFVFALLSAASIEPLLFNASPRDPKVFLVVAAVLVSTAVLATWIPALRARRVNPVEALRAE